MHGKLSNWLASDGFSHATSPNAKEREKVAGEEREKKEKKILLGELGKESEEEEKKAPLGLT